MDSERVEDYIKLSYIKADFHKVMSYLTEIDKDITKFDINKGLYMVGLLESSIRSISSSEDKLIFLSNDRKTKILEESHHLILNHLSKSSISRTVQYSSACWFSKKLPYSIN